MAPSLETSLSSLAISSNVNGQIYALLEQDRFAEALKLAQSNTTDQVSKLYVAYAQYRLGREEECLITIGDAQDRASLHLKAQALYRLERVSFSDLAPLKSNTVVENEAADIEVNEAAIAAQRTLLSKSIDNYGGTTKNTTHEYLFNKSILLSSQNRTDEALATLKNATDSLKSLNLDQADYDAEIAPIDAQIAHLTGDASRNFESSLKETDSSTQFLTSINFLEDSNPYVLFKAYQPEASLKPSARLFSYQDRYVAYDRIVVLHRIGLSIKKAVQKYTSRFGNVDPERCSALRTLSHTKASKQSLETRLKEDPADVNTAVALISRLVRQKQGVSKALKVIEQLTPEARSQHPGIIGIWAALSDLTASTEATTFIENAMRQATGLEREELLGGYIQRAIKRTKVGTSPDESAVASSLQELLMLNPSNMVGQSTQCVMHPEQIEEILPLPDLSSIDVVALELGSKRALDTSEPVRRVKKVKTKTQAQIEGESKLDPERWLPKRDRTDYKPSKKDKQKSAGGHQGGMVDESLSSRGPSSAVKTSEAQRKKKKKKAGAK